MANKATVYVHAIGLRVADRVLVGIRALVFVLTTDSAVVIDVIRVRVEALVAHAVVATACIDAMRVSGALRGRSHALVDIFATGMVSRGISAASETGPACAAKGSAYVCAFGVRMADRVLIGIRALVFVLATYFTVIIYVIGVRVKAVVTSAIVTTVGVNTMGVGGAGVELWIRAFVEVFTAIAVARKPRVALAANAGLIIVVTSRERVTGVILALVYIRTVFTVS